MLDEASRSSPTRQTFKPGSCVDWEVRRMKTAGRRMPRPVEPSGTRVSAWGYTKMVRFYLKDAPAAVAEGRIFRSGLRSLKQWKTGKYTSQKSRKQDVLTHKGGSVTRYIPRHERNIPQPTPHTRPQSNSSLSFSQAETEYATTERFGKINYTAFSFLSSLTARSVLPSLPVMFPYTPAWHVDHL